MNIFLSDLDNTLIYSHRHLLPADKTVMEFLHGRDQSYMTSETYRFLKYTGWIKVIPVTSRNEEQFRRLKLQGLYSGYAVICNGGKLLIDGLEDPDWTAESMKNSESQISELDETAKEIGQLIPTVTMHHPEPYMYYFRTSEPEKWLEHINEKLPRKNVLIQCDKRKIYLFAQAINKGNAAKRIKQLLHPDLVVSAGDGVMDIPMLNESDYAFAPSAIYDKVSCSGKYTVDGEIISDQICRKVTELHDHGILKEL